MWKSIKVLLIDDLESRRHDLNVILDFVGEGTIVASSSEWKSKIDSTEEAELLCALVGDVDSGIKGLVKDLKESKTHKFDVFQWNFTFSSIFPERFRLAPRFCQGLVPI